MWTSSQFLHYSSVRKNFFDDDDDDGGIILNDHDKKSDTDVGEDFETFVDDEDFANMRIFSSQPNVSDEVDNENLGVSWGGKAYSFQQGSND